MGEQVPKKVVCKELGWGFWDGLGRYYNFFPFKIVGNNAPGTRLFAIRTVFCKELETDNNR